MANDLGLRKFITYFVIVAAFMIAVLTFVSLVLLLLTGTWTWTISVNSIPVLTLLSLLIAFVIYRAEQLHSEKSTKNETDSSGDP